MEFKRTKSRQLQNTHRFDQIAIKLQKELCACPNKTIDVMVLYVLYTVCEWQRLNKPRNGECGIQRKPGTHTRTRKI